MVSFVEGVFMAPPQGLLLIFLIVPRHARSCQEVTVNATASPRWTHAATTTGVASTSEGDAAGHQAQPDHEHEDRGENGKPGHGAGGGGRGAG